MSRQFYSVFSDDNHKAIYRIITILGFFHIFRKLSKNKNPKIQTSIFLYQINPPNVEPKFNVVFDGNLIPCPTKDINLFHAFSIYFYLLSSNSSLFVMNLGIHNFINELLK